MIGRKSKAWRLLAVALCIPTSALADTTEADDFKALREALRAWREEVAEMSA